MLLAGNKGQFIYNGKKAILVFEKVTSRVQGIFWLLKAFVLLPFTSICFHQQS